MYSDPLMQWIREHMDFIMTHTCADPDDPYDYIKFECVNRAAEELEGIYFPESYATSKYNQIFDVCINDRAEALKLLKYWYTYHIRGYRYGKNI